MTITTGVSQFNQLQNKPQKNRFGGFNRIPTHGVYVCAAVLYHLSYEDPYNGKQANLLSSSTCGRNETKDEMNCELRKYKWNEDVIQ